MSPPRRGRPRELDEDVIAALIDFGVKPGVIAVAFGVHPKTVARAHARRVRSAPTLDRYERALRLILARGCVCAVEENDMASACDACIAGRVLGGGEP